MPDEHCKSESSAALREDQLQQTSTYHQMFWSSCRRTGSQFFRAPCNSDNASASAVWPTEGTEGTLLTLERSHKALSEMLQRSPLDQMRLNQLGTTHSWKGLSAWERKLGLELLLWTEGTMALAPYGEPAHPPTCSLCIYHPMQALET